ncbi:heparinase II/III-family protein [Pseudohaliea sp.]|uniref:heparinase II/III-family protein n=1 Tax=Pseudohaliea sp. TaxID=2740289 RepID=UPI0032EF01ED
MQSLARLYWRLRYLTPLQLMQRLRLRLQPAARLRPQPAASVVPPPGAWQRPALAASVYLGKHRFRLLGRELCLALPRAWSDSSLGRKFLMELNTFNWLRGCNREDGAALLESWVAAQGRPGGPGWHPYMTSQRIGNWLLWSRAGHDLSPAACVSLVQQLRYLEKRLAYDECDHKLISNARALLFAGHCLSHPRAARWRCRGEAMLSRWLPRLVLGDGGYRGASPMYHSALLLDLLDIANLYSARGNPPPEALARVVPAALHWLRALCHTDGAPALFNDCAFEVTVAPAELEAYALRLGWSYSRPPVEGCELFAETGFARLQAGPALLLADVGPLGPDCAAAHGHADTLTFEFTLGPRRVFVDGGLSTYEGLAQRLRERGTAAHNTLLLDGRNSSDVWGLFKLGRRARILARETGEDGASHWVRASHDGYRRGGSPAIHERCWRLGEDELQLEDRLEGRGNHAVELRFQVHPELDIEELPGRRLRIGGAGFPGLELELDERLSLSLEPFSYGTHFGPPRTGTAIVGRARLQLPVSLSCRGCWPARVPARSE